MRDVSEVLLSVSLHYELLHEACRDIVLTSEKDPNSALVHEAMAQIMKFFFQVYQCVT